jgi:hypothetical protein
MLLAQSPKRKSIIGSFEAVTGVALGDVKRKDRYAEVEIEYAGETDIWWDEQRQKEEDGEKLWVDEAHDIWRTSELVWIDTETGMVVPVEDKNG